MEGGGGGVGGGRSDKHIHNWGSVRGACPSRDSIGVWLIASPVGSAAKPQPLFFAFAFI